MPAPWSSSTASLHIGPDRILCAAISHVDPANPLRHAGRLAAICGVEYALQAAALHGALLAEGQPQSAGYAASLRDIALHVDRLDDPAHGDLHVAATLACAEPSAWSTISP